MVLKLQRAKTVSDTLQSILNGMGKIIHGVDAPLVTLTVMVHMADTVDHRVTHIEVAGGKVDLCTQGILVILKLTGTHTAEQVQAFLHGTVPVRGLGRGGQIAPVFLELLRGQLANIGKSLLDQLLSQRIGLFKVIRSVEEPVTPIKAQPADILLDGIYVFRVFFGGVGVVHTQIAHAAEFFRGAEVDDQCLAVTDVQVTVGFRGKPGMDGLACVAAALGNILFNKGMDEIFAFIHFSHR